MDRPGKAGDRRRWLALAGIVAGGSALIAVGTTRVHEWVVQTDEMLYTKLARNIGHTGSPIPTLHGQRVGFVGVVYPILLAPFYAVLDAVDAFTAAHAVNAVLFASAAVPVYLLGRRLVSPDCALVVALLTVTVPWVVNAAFVMSEPAAYPVFVWAVLACHVAIADPSDRADLLAAAALALAYFTRPQFLFLVAVLPLAVLLTTGPRRALPQHRVVAALYAAGGLIVIALAALGQAHRLLGDYGVTATEGSLLPAIAWKSAALHIDVLAIGLGVVPFLLGGGWAYSALRIESVRLRAFAALTALSLPILALETASYDVRFGGPDVIRDRYLFYLAPLLLLATAVCLFQERLPLAGIAAMTVFFSATVLFADFAPVAGIWVDSAESVLNGLIHDQSGGLPAGVFVALCGALLGVICLGLALVPRPAAVLGVTIAVFCFGGAVTGYAFHRLLTSTTPLGVPVTGQPRVRDWVDRAIPTGSRVALLAYPISRDWGQSAIQWWDAEFWNNRVQSALVANGENWTYTPFPSTTLRLNFDTGRFKQTDDAPPYVLSAPNESRFDLAGSQAATNAGLVLEAVDRPYRVQWATRGLDIDGWTRPGRSATIRVYAVPEQSSSRVARVTAALDAPPEASSPVPFRLGDAHGTVPPGGRAQATASVCLPAGGHADLTLEAGTSATIGGPPVGPEPEPPRPVGVALSGVQVAPRDQSC